jgi:hypothetical protein
VGDARSGSVKRVGGAIGEGAAVVAQLHSYLAASRSNLATLIVGFSILAAMTVPVYPDFYRSLPSWTQQFTGSIISMSVVVSVPLNALFLLGTWHYSLLHLGTDSTPATAGSFDAFFEKQAKEWKLPAEDAARVRSVVDTAIEYVAANGPVEIQVGSDAFDILVRLRYMGNLPSLPNARPRKEMVEEQSALSAVSPAICLACTPIASNAAPRGSSARSSSSSGCDCVPGRELTNSRRQFWLKRAQHLAELSNLRACLYRGPLMGWTGCFPRRGSL